MLLLCESCFQGSAVILLLTIFFQELGFVVEFLLFSNLLTLDLINLLFKVRFLFFSPFNN